MTWTKTPPTEPGLYWWRQDDDDIPDVVRVSRIYHPEATQAFCPCCHNEISVDALEAQFFGHGHWEQLDADFDGEWWPEPIQPPEER